MDKRRIIIIGLMAVMAVVIFTQVRKMGTPAPVAAQTETIVEKVEYVGILAAAEDIPLGYRLSEEVLTWIDWPKEAVTESMITVEARENAKTELINAIVRTPLVAGEPISASKIIEGSDKGVMAALLSPGMRAVTTRISVDTAAGGFIQPGDRVDIILTEALRVVQDSNQAAQAGQIVRTQNFRSTTIFENVKVLAIDQTFASDPEIGPAVVGSTATFELSQEDAEVLQQSLGLGDISLTLRGVRAPGARGTSAATQVEEEETPPPAQLRIFRATNSETVSIQGR